MTKAKKDNMPRGAVMPRSVIPFGCSIDTGFVMFVSGPGIVSKGIRLMSRHRGEPKSQADHQQLFYDDTNILSFSSKAGPKFYTLVDYWKRMDDKAEEWIIFRRKTRPAPPVKEALKKQMEEANKEWKYSESEFLLHIADNLIEKVIGKHFFLFRRLGKLWKKGVVCSTGSNIILKSVSWLPKVAEFFSPDDTIDYIRARPEDWVEVARSTKWGER